MPHIRSILTAALGAVLVLVSHASLAAIATATFAWDELQVDVLEIPGLGTSQLTFEDLLTQAASSASSFGDSAGNHDHTAFNWDAVFSVGVDTLHADAAAVVSASSLSAEASATPSLSLDAFDSNTSSAQVFRSADFVLSGPGIVVFRIPYSFSVTGALGDFDEHSQASISGSAIFPATDDGSGSSSGNKIFSLDSRFDGETFLSGTLIFGVVADAAGVGSVQFLAETFAQAGVTPIPEPSVVAQVLLGLVGLGLVARRRLALLR